MISERNSLRLNNIDLSFMSEVLNDARNLSWPNGYLRSRERAVQIIFRGRLSEYWKRETKIKDPLFKKKNWNKIESGFRLWGGSSNANEHRIRTMKHGIDKDNIRKSGETEDPLFKKKNWNKIDSGFRLWGGPGPGD